MFLNVLVFHFTCNDVTTSKNVLCQNICKNVAKHFSRIEHGLKIDSGYM